MLALLADSYCVSLLENCKQMTLERGLLFIIIIITRTHGVHMMLKYVREKAVCMHKSSLSGEILMLLLD
jgi:hypothetical protein